MQTEAAKDFRTYVYGEGRTGGGQLIKFSCRPEEREQVQRFFAENVCEVDVPTTKRTSVPHGGYGQYTRYDVVRHEYAGGGHAGCGGFIEVLEIRDAPVGRCGTVVHEEICDHSIFYEFRALPEAVSAWKASWGSQRADQNIPKCDGFLRRVDCGLLLPWFYAVGDQELVGDVAFPARMEPSDRYIPLRKYLVYDQKGMPTIKTCLTVSTVGQDYRQRAYVHWTDGTCWEPTGQHEHPAPRMLTEGELWIEELMEKFRRFLSGHETKFEVEFHDGSLFHCQYQPKTPELASKAGVYRAKVLRTDGTVKSGDFEFLPTPELPTVEGYLLDAGKKAGWEIRKIESLVRVRTLGGKKQWIGVYDPVAAGRLQPATTTSE